jgi:hypothetical protein
VSERWPEVLAPALGNGGGVAFLVAAAVSPGGHLTLALLLERRRIRPREEFAAFIYGDPLLSVACGLGIALSPTGPSGGAARLAEPPALIALAAAWLAFGLWQWLQEYFSRYYTLAQSLAPTKIWHQVVVYPVFGSLVCVGIVSGLLAPVPAYGVKVAIAACAAGWLVLHLYDRGHPRLGHPPYDWSRIRPAVKPWAPLSTTLRSAAGEVSPPPG